MRKQHVYQCRQIVKRAKAIYYGRPPISNRKKIQENETNNLEELYKKIRNKNKLINEKKIKRIYNQ